MNNDFIYNFGVEIHVELRTKTKAFSSSKIEKNAKPNHNINPLDVGYPGAKPRLNYKMVMYSYRLAKVLNMNISDVITFDRKNYFYPDLSKGFQITQYHNPIGTNGYIEIIDSLGNKKIINIKQIHMEEDTAKQINREGNILLDFNRSGVPLIEIVSDYKDFKSIDDVILFTKTIKDQLTFMGISDGKMEDGSFRVDLNVSIRKKEDTKLGNKVEIKNLNSFANIRKSLEYELEVLKEKLLSNKEILIETKRFDEKSNKNITMRIKHEKSDYKFISESNILPIKISKKDLETFNDFDFQSISSIREEMLKSKLKFSDVELVTKYYELYRLFNYLIKKTTKEKSLNFIVQLIIPELVLSDLFTYKFDCKTVGEIMNIYFENKITTKIAKELIKKLLNNQLKIEDINFYKNIEQISSEEIFAMIDELMKSNQTMYNEYVSRPERVKKFLMGQLMKQTKGRLNPKEANNIINAYLEKNKK